MWDRLDEALGVLGASQQVGAAADNGVSLSSLAMRLGPGCAWKCLLLQVL